jgi:2'-5' RNA ligase
VTELGRALVAVVVPPPIRAALETVVAPRRAEAPGWRWTRPEQWHVTVRFLGRVPDVDGLVAALDAAACSAAPFACALLGAGAFPSPARASVVWAGLGAGDHDDDGDAPWPSLAATVDAAVETVGEATAGPGRSGAFRPHLTLARSSRPRSARRLVAGLAGDAGLDGRHRFPVDALVLCSSRTDPAGAVHTELARWPLGHHGPG